MHVSLVWRAHLIKNSIDSDNGWVGAEPKTSHFMKSMLVYFTLAHRHHSFSFYEFSRIAFQTKLIPNSSKFVGLSNIPVCCLEIRPHFAIWQKRNRSNQVLSYYCVIGESTLNPNIKLCTKYQLTTIKEVSAWFLCLNKSLKKRTKQRWPWFSILRSCYFGCHHSCNECRS